MKSDKKTGAKSVNKPKPNPTKPAPSTRSRGEAAVKKGGEQPAGSRKKKITTATASDKPAQASAALTSPPAPLGPQTVPAKPEAAADAPKGVARTRRKLQVPPILLEGDASPAPPIPPTGAAEARYVTGESAALRELKGAIARTATELPEAYGSGRLFVAARDPHWLYCSWDLTSAQLRELNGKSRDGHLVLRVSQADESRGGLPEVHVHPESRTWFLYVPSGDTVYRTELGYYDSNDAWQTVARSRDASTPPDAPSPDISADFATIPAKITIQQLIDTVQEFVAENRSLVESILAAHQFAPEFTMARVETGEPWSEERVAEIARLVTMDESRRIWMGSLEITELIRRRLSEETASIAAAELARGGERSGVPGGPSSEAISSPSGGMRQRGRKFWFNINAELIIYGATEPDATVTIGERKIKLRPDGSFSFRFALPDGRYELPARAVSGDGEESKQAALEFSRRTEYGGEVQAHPQDPGLKAPSAEHVE